MKARLADLESLNATFQQRLENERKHTGEQYTALKERYDKELETRKSLEERLKALEVKPARRQRSQNRGRGRSQGFLHGNPRPNPNPNAVVIVNNNQVRNPGQNVPAANITRRPSGLPLPIRPSTPIRPAYNREPGSSSSTLVSSVHSTFSQRSLQTNGSYSSVDSNTLRSSSPDSPTTARHPSSPVMNVRQPVSPVVTNGDTIREAREQNPTHASKPSWAKVVRSASHI